MDKRALAEAFRVHFRTMVDAERHDLPAFLDAVGIDRSALSQFLDPKRDRLPRAETLRRIAQARGVSVDWLLCLENAPEGRQEVTPNTVLEAVSDDEGNSMLARWHRDADGAKLRYVPATLPDMLGLPDLFLGASAGADPRGGEAGGVLDGSELGDRDVEIAMPIQTLHEFAARTGIWATLPRETCIRQLEHMAVTCEDSYPALRLHLYDGGKVYSAPFTVFGRIRAAVYVGDAYLSSTSPEQVRFFTKRFDHLVRQAVVAPDRVHDDLRALALSVR